MEYILKNIAWLAVIAGIVFLFRRIRRGKRETIAQELIGGIILGNLVFFGIPFFEPMKHSIILEFLSELAISFFLFRIAFSGSLAELRQIGFRALLVALVGVGTSFFLGLYFIPYLFVGLTDIQYVFIAAALTTTSVGITAGILKEMGKLELRSAKIILGAAIIDDIISLFILSIITTQIHSGSLGVAGIDLGIMKILVFIVFGLAIGHVAARFLPETFYHVYPHVSAKLFVAFSFFIVFFLGSKTIGLSPIVGAFIGGLVLERGYFDGGGDQLHGKYVESTIERVSAFVIPLFFIMTGLQMNLGTIFSARTILLSLGLLVVAVAGKLACGLVAGRGANPWLVGLGMVPRGEVGLVFANIGLATALLSPDIFSSFIIMIIATTLLTPFVINKVVAKTAS